jgi:hypothetical protein
MLHGEILLYLIDGPTQKETEREREREREREINGFSRADKNLHAPLLFLAMEHHPSL